MKVFSFLINILLHIIAIGVLLFAFWPIALWYFNHRPILGVDFFNTATLAKFLHDNFTILPDGYKYIWYTGVPVFVDFINIWYFIVAIVNFFIPLLDSVKLTMLVSFFLFLVFTYFAAFRLSRNHFVSLLIATLVAYSPNMYGSLTWGGSLPYFGNQFFFPLVLFLLASYLETGKRIWFWLLIPAYGFALSGHLANTGAFILPSLFLMLVFGYREGKTTFLQRILDFAIIFFGGYIFAYRAAWNFVPQIFRTILSAGVGPLSLGGGSAAKVQIGAEGVSVSGNPSLVAFERSHFGVLFQDTNYILYLVIGFAVVLFLATFFLISEKKKALAVIPWTILAGYSVLQVFLNSYGISFAAQGWYRAYWHFPLTIGLFSAALIGHSLKIGKVGYVIISILAAVFTFAPFVLGQSQATIRVLEEKSSISSAHPEAINLVENQSQLNELKAKLLPKFLSENERNYTLFTSDAQVNVWWNSLFSIPLARGYLDPPIGQGRAGNHFLLDQSIGGDDIIKNFKYEENAARNMALYYMDWYAVKYLEGGRLSQSPNKAPSSYLKDIVDDSEEIKANGAYLLYATKSGKPEIHEEVPQYLKFYKFKDDFVTPILSGTNAQTLLCLCDWPLYESLTHALALNNVNSEYLITVSWPGPIDSLNKEELANFDVVVASSYKYRSSAAAFSLLSGYLKNGGKLFIDTGGEVPESKGSLPSLFPFTTGERGGLGKDWDGAGFEEFSPPLYNKDEWSFSYPISGLKPNSEILLSQKGKPILVRRKEGKGEMVWSGMNLMYHIQANNNLSESKYFLNILKSFIPLEKKEIEAGRPSFVRDNLYKLDVPNKVRGIIFKMQLWEGWEVNLNGKSAKVYPAGPAYPGFIYVPVEKSKVRGDLIHAEFRYRGDVSWYLISFFPIAISLIIILNKKADNLLGIFKKKTSGWWEKEEG